MLPYMFASPAPVKHYSRYVTAPAPMIRTAPSSSCSVLLAYTSLAPRKPSTHLSEGEVLPRERVDLSRAALPLCLGHVSSSAVESSVASGLKILLTARTERHRRVERERAGGYPSRQFVCNNLPPSNELANCKLKLQDTALPLVLKVGVFENTEDYVGNKRNSIRRVNQRLLSSSAFYSLAVGPTETKGCSHREVLYLAPVIVTPF